MRREKALVYAQKYIRLRDWYLALSEEERKALPKNLREDIEFLIELIEPRRASEALRGARG